MRVAWVGVRVNSYNIISYAIKGRCQRASKMAHVEDSEKPNSYHLKFLGTSAGIPTSSRSNSAILLSTENNKKYLIEAGDSCAQSLVKARIAINDIDAIFISHMHADHCAGLPMLVQCMQLTNRKERLLLFMPEEGCERTKINLDMLYLVDDVLPFKLDIKKITVGQIFKNDRIKIKAEKTVHLMADEEIGARYSQNKLQAYSFKISWDKKSIVYSGDIGDIDRDLREYFDDEIDLLIVELAHMRAEEMFKYLSDKKVKRVCFSHIKHTLEHREKYLKNLGKKYLNCRFDIAYDGLNLVI